MGVFGFSFSWERALGITNAKQKFAKSTGVPTSEARIERKLGSFLTKQLLGRK
jgi:hypothetical protein